MFRQLQFGNHSELVQLQTLLRKYTACLAIGELRTDKGYVPHCFVVLLDSHAVDRAIVGSKYGAAKMLPALAIEGTNYTQSVWKKLDRESTYTKSQQIYNDQFKFKRILHSKADHDAVVADKMYGRVASLLTASETRAYHFLCVNKNGSVGVEINDLLNYSPDISLVTATKLDKKQIGELLESASELPKSVLPLSYKGSEFEVVRSGFEAKSCRYWMRKIDYIENRSEIEKLAKNKGTFTHIHVTDRIEVTVLQLE